MGWIQEYTTWELVVAVAIMTYSDKPAATIAVRYATGVRTHNFWRQGRRKLVQARPQNFTVHFSGRMNRMDYEKEESLFFELIASLWREREVRSFVSRAELHQELVVLTMDGQEYSDELVVELAHQGIDSCLDAFAMTGPDETLWRKTKYEGDAGLPRYWRYLVERDGIPGYVKQEDLTDQEREAHQTRLLKEAFDAEMRAKALEQWIRHNCPRSKGTE